MTLLEPMWLLLAVPLGLAVWHWRVPGRGTQVLRAVVCLLLVLALAKLAVVLPGHGATVVVVADRSASMPANAASLQRELIGTLGGGMRPEDRLAVVSFGRSVRIEQSPDHQPFGGFMSEVGADASNLADAVESALSLVPADRPGRVVVLSDGRWTGRDLTIPSSRAAGRGVPVDYRLIERPVVNDLAIERFEGPSRVTREQEFLLTAHVRSPSAQRASYELRRGDRVIASGTQDLAAGRTRLTFRDAVGGAGTAAYTLRVRGELEDPQLENNTARLLVGVDGRRPILLVSEKTEPPLASVLRAGGLDVTATEPGAFSGTLAELGGYAAVIIEDVPARALGNQKLANLAEWVQHGGGGVLKTGGRQSFGAGGYFEGPLDPVLPVSMELRQEHRLHATAMVLVIDRSGSMSGQPIALAREASKLAVDMLTPMDEVGVITFDTNAHVVSALQSASDADAIKNRIARIQSGGGTYMYAGMLAARDMLRGAASSNRHMIVLGDGLTPDADHLGLVDELQQMNVTVSTVALGTGADRQLLSAIAERGGGRYYETLDPTELPQLFAQDIEVVARSTFIEEPTAVTPQPAFRGLLGWSPGQVPAVGGYSLTYLRDDAQAGATTRDEYEAPLLAAWQAGLGRAVAYTGEADGPFTGPIGQWDEVGSLMTSLARWAAGEQEELGDGMVLTQQLDEGRLRVRLHLDPDADGPLLDDLPELTILRGYPGETPEPEEASMQYVAADELGYDVILHGSETVIVTAAVESAEGGEQVATLAPVTLPYPPEYAPVTTRRGVESLRQLARASGGMERLDMGGVWSHMPRQPRLVNLAPYLLLTAAMVFLIEVFERRTGQVSRLADLLLRRRQRPGAEATRQEEPGQATPSPAHRPTRPAPPQPQPTPATDQEPHGRQDDAAEPGVFAALDEARRRAHQRTRRGG